MPTQLSKTDSAPLCSLLFHHPGRSSSHAQVASHSHPFWQLEIGVSGPITWQTEADGGTLGRGEALLVPPGCMHSFCYPDTEVSWYTLKFSCAGANGSGGRLLSEQHILWPTVNAVRETALKLPPVPETEADRGNDRVGAGLAILETLLTGICRHGLQNDHTDRENGSGAESLLSRAEAALSASGPRPVRVTELADHLALSPGHLSERFRNEYQMSVKAFIDQCRYRAIERLLAFDDAPIKLIAAQAGFRDLYSFSRFVKRLSGRSPREVRADARSAQ